MIEQLLRRRQKCLGSNPPPSKERLVSIQSVLKFSASATFLLATAFGVNAAGRSAVVDCRAGCQGNEKGCQESYNKNARLDSAPGRYFDAATLRITKVTNASDSPGLAREPMWQIVRVPDNASQPTSLIITPDLSSCIGRSPHTQGVTFYEWTADYFE